MTAPEKQHIHHPHKPKSEHDKFLEDFIYTLNHAVVCGATDLADPLIGAYTDQKYSVSLHHWFEHRFEKWFGIHLDHHHHHKLKWGEPGFWKEFGHNVKEWAIGEAVGDIGAVPITLGIQYAAPGFMRGIQYVTEPVLGPAFRLSANLHTKRWAADHGFEADSPEAKQRADEIYQHEVSHLPHAFVWTGTAAAGNVITQKVLFPKKSVPSLIVGKAAGSIATLVTVLGLRTLTPNVMQRVDNFNSEKVAKPITRFVSTNLLGIDPEKVEEVLHKEDEFETGRDIVNASGTKDTPDTQVSQLHSETLKPLNFARMIG